MYTIYRLTPRDRDGVTRPWNQRVLHQFVGGNSSSDGFVPQGGLLVRRDDDGALSIFGTTVYGGRSNAGIVYHLHVTP